MIIEVVTSDIYDLNSSAHASFPPVIRKQTEKQTERKKILSR